jgi:aldehyde dehydrogenase (NAD+)
VQASAGNLKRLSLALGGKSPDVVFANADLEAAGLEWRW